MKAVLLALALVLSFGGHEGPPHKSEAVEREVYLMGTTLKVTIFAEDKQQGIAQIDGIVQAIEKTEQQLSTWRADSELSRLNEQALNQPFHCSASLFELLQKCKRWSAATDGAFDPTVGRVIQAWGIHDSFRIPGSAELHQALEHSGFEFVRINQQHITKTRAVRMDPGAFGKGEALDRALAIAKEEGTGAMLLDFGGHVAVNFSPPGKKGWQVSIADPIQRTESSSVQMLLTSGSLSTSGGSERNGHVGNKEIGHIVDPATGQPVAAFGSVTVWHREALVADILSTALYVMGPSKGYDWAVRNQIAACFLVVHGEELKTKKTPQFERIFSQNPPPYDKGEK